MDKRYFTIGMAGHIDHGKTSLTKALTNVDTDRLKEEKERQISIELGFAPFYKDKDMQISVIDVPGHERFIRQMIAGVAGIDLVVLVVAADEGVMPQTKEHLDILQLLGIQNGIVAITKIDRVEEEFIDLVKEDILEELKGTVFEQSPFLLVDSISKKGIEELKKTILSILKSEPMREIKGAFRLPIDQVFTVKGQGTVVRGTVYEGTVEEGQMLTILPHRKETRARQLQVHHQSAQKAFAGQRVAINLSGISKVDLDRGDVLVSSEYFIVTNTMDVALKLVKDLDYIVKQRMPIKVHLGTAEVMGKIIFFDRNEVASETGEILCQLRLEEEIVTKRGDRFIIRRPTPVETVGGGWVIDPRGEKYRFGQQTMDYLESKKVGTPRDRITNALKENKSLTIHELQKITSLDEECLSSALQNEEFILFSEKNYTLSQVITNISEDIFEKLGSFHIDNSMKQGAFKAEILQGMQKFYPKLLLEFVIKELIVKGSLKGNGQYLSRVDFSPHIPSNWVKRTDHFLDKLKKDGMQVQYLPNYVQEAGIPEIISVDIIRFLEQQQQIISITEQFYWHMDVYERAVDHLRLNTKEEFEVGEAKEILSLTRKYLIPFLELLDKWRLTSRVENKRIWL